MKTSLLSLAVALTAATPAFAAEGDEQSADTIVVTAPRLTATDAATEADEELSTGPDGAAFIARQPGAAVVANGTLSGQVQMRGLFGERILLRINGQRFATGGPNAMDPAMHYAPMMLIDRIEIARGISPVRDGPGLGGGVNTILKHARFGDGSSLSPQIDLTSQYRSVDDSVAIGGLVALASDSLRLGVIGSYEAGDDIRFPGGRIGSTSFHRTVYGVQAGFRAGPGEFSLEYRRQDTGRSGNPPFAMDIVYFHTDFARAGFEGDLNDDLRLEVHANYTGVSHRMNNYELRPAPIIAMTRQSDTYADTMAADASLRFGSADRHIRVGGDFELIDKGYVLYNPLSPAFFIHPLDRASSDRVGGFVEWRSGFGAIESELGLRIDRHGASTGPSRFGPGVPAGPVNLANAFALADRNWSGTSVDASLRLWAEMDAFTPRLTLAHKTRAPSLIERYSWLPTEASGGLADGNIYVGDVNLKIEKAWIAELGVDWQGDTAYARPVIYYRRINDFIQGIPFDTTPGILNTPVEIVSNGRGDPTPLRFANTDARIWGADIAFGAKIAGPLRLDGVASYVRAERTDIADNLYRMAPANGRLAVSWEESRWSISVEGQFIARQHHVSATNTEAPSAGYVLANISGYWLIRDGVRLDLGIENLFDTYYLDHLAGYNRITGSDVPLGSRLPGAGRSAFARIRWAM
ncbi:TonB-dependent receptor [Sphingobium indicum BiD32]|uniref:TonB-dependent receptor n=1 Tax=Sphingobium indicum BiD32 TaxID=1301087 RepID=N1MWJ6_9SPHN|nr:TonB-dependent receptor [Sphingobium indicum]CCW19947.1 TonB-dependent receptor [Sphingobium indicum BiD32]